MGIKWKEDYSAETQRKFGITIGLTIGVVAGLLGGFILGWAWHKRPGALSTVSLLSLLTAIGTCGAVVVAVGLHKIKRRLTIEESRASAQLYALQNRVMLQYFVNLNEGLAKESLRFLNEGMGEEVIRNVRFLSKSIIDFEEVVKMDLDRLAPISRKLTANLAVGLSQVRQGASAINALVNQNDFLSSDPEYVKKGFATVFVIFNAGKGFLNNAFSEINEVCGSYFGDSLKR